MRYIDRGEFLTGASKTIRDSRVPYTKARAIENFSLPDSRARRRAGYKATSDKVVAGQMLTKTTPAIIERKAYSLSTDTRADIFRTPLSYGLIRYNSLFQPKTTSDWTIEFYAVLGDHESLVVEPFNRRANKSSGSITYNLLLRQPGVYLLDWTVLSNYHKFNTGTIASPGTAITLTSDHSGADKFYDSFPLTTMAVTFQKSSLTVTMGLVEFSGGTTGTYWPKEVSLSYGFAGGAYTPNQAYHIAIRNKGSTATVSLVVNGVEAASYTNPDTDVYKFVGEYDEINGLIYNAGIARDIVLLNECTARASYSSCCKIQKTMHGHQAFYQDYTFNTTSPAVPWACSPPKGTGMRDLRIWNTYRSDAQIQSTMFTSLVDLETEPTLVANWHLDSGTGIDFDTQQKYPCSLHHSYPAYVQNPGLLNQLGLHFSEGQYMILSTEKGDKFYIKDIATQLVTCFGWDSRGDTAGQEFAKTQPRHDFTVQAQIVTPKVWQPELNNTTTGSPFTTKTLKSCPVNGTTESRRSMSGGSAFNDCSLYTLTDGGTVPAAGLTSTNYGDKINLINHDGDTSFSIFTRAYDMTLFSIESGSFDTNNTNEGPRSRVPLVRGLLTPSGNIAFELSLHGAFDSPRFYRVVTSTTLANDTAYTLTFVKRSRYTAASPVYPVGFAIEIWIHGTLAPTVASISFIREILLGQANTSHTPGNPHKVNITMPTYFTTGDTFEVTLAGMNRTSGAGPASLDGTYVATVASGGFTIPVDTTGSTYSNGTVDFNPGLRSSVCRSEWDFDIVVGASNVRGTFDKSITGPNATTISSGEGPWITTQRFMSPYQDQPGNFTLGLFRLWNKALSLSEIQQFGKASIPDKRVDNNLLINVEIDQVSGNQIPNKTRYSTLLDLGFKGWGVGEAYQFKHAVSSTTTHKWAFQPLIPNGYSMQDCLGYSPMILPNNLTYYTTANAQCNGLFPYQSTLSRQFALMGVFSDGLVVDPLLNGDMKPLTIDYGGLLNEFAAGLEWRGVSIADTTIIVSPGGIPKTFDGKNITSLGFKKWAGGAPTVRVDSLTTGSGLAPGWYAIRLVYTSETRGIQDISDLTVINIGGSTNAGLSVLNIPAHPDPRVSSFTIYRSRMWPTREAAISAPLFPLGDINQSNSFTPVISIQQPDNTLVPAPLDLDNTPAPICQFSLVANDRLYLLKDVLIPDAVYFSAPGNPQKFNVIDDRLVLESDGDSITGGAALFGVVYVFKSHSLWRITELNGEHQVERVADVGASSPGSIEIITNPDTGRTVIFFWSHHGPYLFDGTSPQYIGFDIEERTDPGVISSEFTWLEPTSVRVLHDIRNRELICLYRAVLPDGTVLPRVTEAVVYNYRFNSWYRYTGMQGSVTLAQTFSGERFTGFGQSSSPVLSISQGIVDSEILYNAYIGGTNGRVYRWGESEEDGLPDLSVGPFNILDVQGTLVTLDTILTPHAYRHLHVTFIKPGTGDVFTVPIDDNDAVNLAISAQFGTLPFTLTVKDLAYLCFPPGFIEFPWDAMDTIFVDKQIGSIVTWNDKTFFINVMKDWDSRKIISWKQLSKSETSKRNKTYLNIEAEAVKIQLYSLDKGAALDSFGYLVDIRSDAINVK